MEDLECQQRVRRGRREGRVVRRATRLLKQRHRLTGPPGWYEQSPSLLSASSYSFPQPLCVQRGILVNVNSECCCTKVVTHLELGGGLEISRTSSPRPRVMTTWLWHLP